MNVYKAINGELDAPLKRHLLLMLMFFVTRRCKNLYNLKFRNVQKLNALNTDAFHLRKGQNMKMASFPFPVLKMQVQR